MAVFLSWSGVRRRLIICRLLACTITGSLLLLLCLSPAVSSQPTQVAANRHHGVPHVNTRSNGPITKAQIRMQQESAHDSVAPRRKETVLHVASMSSAAELTTKRPSDSPFIEQVLNLTSYIPDEARTNTLLAQLPTVGGSTLLRDLALRTRVFREAFAYWESLHLITDDNGQIRLQNVIQKLRYDSASAVNLQQAMEVYDRFRVFINALAIRLFPWTTPYFADHMMFHASFHRAGRGLVFTAGSHQAEYLETSIPAIRRLGCDLPVEVIYLGDDDLSEDAREGLEKLEGVVTRDVSQMVDDKAWTVNGWAAKPFAMLYSSFREVIFIDADALFITNPEQLFEDEQYRKTGALFFKDRSMMPESKKSLLRQALPKPISDHVKTNRLWTGESGHMQDSGVVVVDKWRHFVSLLLTTRLNGPDRDGDKSTGKQGVYDMMYGDKETFWLSWELAGDLDYAFYDGMAGNMGVLRRPEDVDEDDFDEEYEDDYEDEDEFEEEQEPEVEAPKADIKHRDDPSAQRHSFDTAADSHTICSPQLLHFDRAGKPMWFNGWVATKKFDSLKFRPFDAYMREPSGKRPKGSRSAWELKGNNIVCLTSDEYFDFTTEEQVVLDGLLTSAETKHREIMD